MQIFKSIPVAVLVLLLLSATSEVDGGPVVGAFVYMGCVVAAAACYTAAGAVFGTVHLSLAAASPALMACNAIFLKCTAAAIAAIASPTP